MPAPVVVRIYIAVHWLWRGHRPEVFYDGIGLGCLACDLPGTGDFVGAWT